jgi:tetratricopeptide (TPR) repeat protein
MSDATENNNKLILTKRESGLVRVGNSVAITNRLLNQEISDLFNQGFCKLNSQKIKSIDRDYLFVLEHTSNQQIVNEFEFKAESISDYKQCIDILNNVLRLKPNHSLTHTMIGLSYLKLAYYDSTSYYFNSWETLLKAAALDSTNALAPYFYEEPGDHLCLDEESLQQIKTATRAIEIDCNFAHAYFKRANAKSALKDKLGALRDLNQAIRLDDQHSSWFYRRGQLRAELRSFTEAKEDLIRAFELDLNAIRGGLENDESTNMWQRFYLEWLGLYAGQDDEYMEFYKEVRQMFPHIEENSQDFDY